jgi:hypothetical protein
MDKLDMLVIGSGPDGRRAAVQSAKVISSCAKSDCVVDAKNASRRINVYFIWCALKFNIQFYQPQFYANFNVFDPIFTINGRYPLLKASQQKLRAADEV